MVEPCHEIFYVKAKVKIMIMACKCKRAENEHIINGSMGPVNVSHCAFGLYTLFFNGWGGTILGYLL